MVTTIDGDDNRKGQASGSSARSPSNVASGISSAVNPTSFYGSNSAYNRQSNTNSNVSRTARGATTPPTLPRRPGDPSYQSDIIPPPQTSFGGSSYREPELVPPDDDVMPDLIPSTHGRAEEWPTVFDTDFNGSSTLAGWDQPDYSSRLAPATHWGAPGDDALLGGDGYENMPPIDGRNLVMERRWWDIELPGLLHRPGYGMLAPLLVDLLHNPYHSLVSVSVSPPEITAASISSASASVRSSPAPAPGTPPAAAVAPSGSHSRSSSISNSPPPTAVEVREGVPHPNAYYCRRHNGWIILAWRSSTILPPLTPSFTRSPHAPLPNPERRKGTHNCIDIDFSGKTNLTHHFHRYEKAVDAAQMTPRYTPRAWERAERSKLSHRRMTIGSDDLDPEVVARAVSGDEQSEKATNMITEAKEEEETQMLLDLYVCCQCSLYVVVSDVIPGVVPTKTVEAFVTEKSSNPPPGKTDRQSTHIAWETVITVLENKLWKGNSKALSIHGKAFSTKVGWSPTVQKLFESMGFKLTVPTPKDGAEQQPMLQPPDTDTSTEVGRANRDRLIRAWIEISAIISEYRRSYPIVIKDYSPHRLWVKTEYARDLYQPSLGAHPDQLKRGVLPDVLRDATQLNTDWEKLGMTSSTYDIDVLHFAYLAQCRCDPQRTPEYFQALCNIVGTLRTVLECPASLETLVGAERSRGRFTPMDVLAAAHILGFGADNDLRVDYDEDVDGNFLSSAWRDALRRSWGLPDSASRRHDVNEAYRILAEYRRNIWLVKEYEDEILNGMTPDKAYSTLEVPMGVDEEMLITVFNMRVEDSPLSLPKMRDAMRVIAEVTFSERLQKFLETGSDPGVVVAQTRPDWPRGLNQLGNTCYLNSLLQYFYTIKDLRDAIAPLAVEEKFMDSDKLKDDDLKNHRVGGRMVSRSEVVRSRKFVSQLANLFLQMENSEVPAVTPTLELAKLALVTSKDEEEEDPERGGTDSSNSTDATLVDEPAPMRESSSPQPKSPSLASSVLGKRPRGFGRKKSVEGGPSEDLDKDKDGYVLVSKPSGSNTPVVTTADAEGDIQMGDATAAPVANAPEAGASKAPPLPPRPKTTQSSGSSMMFGKQHDVAECMDNCMFQIETALLRFGELVGPDDSSSKRSIVKRLFYGKIRQRLSVPPDPKKSKSSLHEREDYFSHLPVNVSEESFDLYDGLSGYFATEDDVDFEGTRAKMNVSLVELPPILQVQLQRVQFNRETLQPYKSHAYVKFGETICMDRFLDDAPAEKKAKAKEIQAELNSCRERINQLTQGKHAPFEQNFDDAHSFLSKQTALDMPEATEEFKNFLLFEKERITNEIGSYRARVAELKAQLEDVWQGEARAEYELTSVFVHRGASPTFGHYFIYQRWLPDHPDEWFRYNDSDVSEATKAEVLADTTGDTANPYLLVFARKGSQVINTVHRADPMAAE